MTEFVNQWAPEPPELSDRYGRLLDSVCQVDRVNIHLGPQAEQMWNPRAVLPWTTWTGEAYFSQARERARRHVLTFTELDPGSQNQQSGGPGYNRGIPDMDGDAFRRKVRAFKRSLGERLAGIWAVQAGNEIDYCPDVTDAGKRLEWFQYNVLRCRILRQEFPDAIVFAGGMTLIKDFRGMSQFNWWAASQGLPGRYGFALDWHWNNRTVSQIEQEFSGFPWRHSYIGCLENTAKTDKATFAALAKRLDLLCYGDFNGSFPFERWGVGRSEWGYDLAVHGWRGGRWIFNQANQDSSEGAARTLGTYRPLPGPGPEPPPPDPEPDPEPVDPPDEPGGPDPVLAFAQLLDAYKDAKGRPKQRVEAIRKRYERWERSRR